MMWVYLPENETYCMIVALLYWHQESLILFYTKTMNLYI